MTATNGYSGHMSSSKENVGSQAPNSKRTGKSSRRQDKPKANHSGNKRAFDAVLNHVRKIGRPWLSPSHAVNPELAGSGGSRNPAKPNLVEFWADVFLAVKASCPRDVSLVKFHLAYTLYDSEDVIENELHAHRTIGDRRHSVEQRVGAEFIRRGIYPTQGRGYFWAERKKR